MSLIDLSTRSAIRKGLHDHLGVQVIRSNQAGDLPSYPYISYTITTVSSQNNGTYGEYEDGVNRKSVTQTWSWTVQAEDDEQAMELALRARDWFDYYGRQYLANLGVIVQSLTGISNRDNMLTIEYEYRKGFDVVFSMVDEVAGKEETVGSVEGVTLNNAEFEVESIDDLNEALEKRLDGVK